MVIRNDDMEEPALVDTSTLERARAHARSQARTAPASGVTIPATAAVDLPDGVDPSDVIWDERVAGGGYASCLLPRGAILRVSDVDGDACVHLVVSSASNPAERLNVADTVKVQWQAYLGPGALLLSGLGRALATLVTDTSARHDCICGCLTRRSAADRYGEGGTWGPTPATRDLLAVAAAKRGLDRRDVVPGVNLFKGVRVALDGSLSFEGEPRPGRYVELRAELDLLVLLADAPHPLDDRPEYLATPIRCTAWRAAPAEADPPRAATPERERALLNVDALLAQGLR